MADGFDNPESPRFEIMPGLPGNGPRPEQFSVTGRGIYSEGFVVRFYPSSSPPWIGNFQPGEGEGCTCALIHPDHRTVIVVVKGQGYQVDPEARRCLRYYRAAIQTIARDDTRRLCVFAHRTDLLLIDAKEDLWESEDLGGDGVRNVRIEGGQVVGEMRERTADRWHPFSISLATGKLDLGRLERMETNLFERILYQESLWKDALACFGCGIAVIVFVGLVLAGILALWD